MAEAEQGDGGDGGGYQEDALKVVHCRYPLFWSHIFKPKRHTWPSPMPNVG
jgi:hypothetical protein